MLGEPTTLIGLGVLLLSNVGLWIDKIFQGKRENRIAEKVTAVNGRNGTSLEGLHTKIDSLTASVALINVNSAISATEIKNMTKRCEETRSAYEKRFEKLEDN